MLEKLRQYRCAELVQLRGGRRKWLSVTPKSAHQLSAQLHADRLQAEPRGRQGSHDRAQELSTQVTHLVDDHDGSILTPANALPKLLRVLQHKVRLAQEGWQRVRDAFHSHGTLARLLRSGGPAWARVGAVPRAVGSGRHVSSTVHVTCRTAADCTAARRAGRTLAR